MSIETDYEGPDQVLTPADYLAALQVVKGACNLRAVVHDFVEIIDHVRAEAKARGCCGSVWVSRHPICRMFASQISQLAGNGCGDFSSFSLADGYCQERSGQ